MAKLTIKLFEVVFDYQGYLDDTVQTIRGIRYEVQVSGV